MREVFTPSGLYVAVRPDYKTQLLLNDWADKSGIILDDNLHITVLYSHAPVKIYSPPSVEFHIAKFSGWDVFGHRPGESYLVAKVNAPSIVLRHWYYKELGGTHDYPVFNPHMTICKYNPEEKTFPMFDIDFDMVFTNEYREPLTE